jgi:hypothetical protein
MSAPSLPRLLPVLLAGAALLAACGPGEPPPDPDAYQLRGVVRQLPDPEKPGSAFLIHHEEIPDFRDRDGEVVGMESMAMPFEVAEPEMLEGVSVGDRIDFRFEMRWEGSPPLLITELETLPEGTRLAFELEPEEDSSEDGDAEDGDGADPAGESGI